MSASRTASLRVAHQRACANASKTSLGSLDGCTCKPSYYTLHRDGVGNVVKGSRVRNRQVADRALRKLLVELDEDRVGVGRGRKRASTFDAWAAEYLEIIGKHGRKASTVAAYGPTVRYARPIFGALDLREVGNPELRRFVEAIKKNKGGDATVSKHLRHLGAIFSAAVDDELAEVNPVPKFKKSLRLRVVGGVESFTDLELARLWASMQAFGVEEVYVQISKAAVVTGMRQGELIGANLGDLDLMAGRLHVRHHYDRAAGVLTLPKDNEERVLHLIPPARALFEMWVAEHGDRDDEQPIFPAPRSGGRINGQYLTRVVEKAMTNAKPPIPKTGENGRPRKPFHAFRSSFDRICREQGRNPEWVQAQLGHSDPRLTLVTYGRWSEDALKAEAERVEAEGFPI
jgi:integrase